MQRDDVERRVLDAVGRAMGQFSMLRPGDRVAVGLGCTTLALGHTADDCAEALLRNILFNGRIASLPPVAQSRKGTLRLIRPLVYATEELTAAYATAQGFRTVGCVCGERASV